MLMTVEITRQLSACFEPSAHQPVISRLTVDSSQRTMNKRIDGCQVSKPSLKINWALHTKRDK